MKDEAITCLAVRDEAGEIYVLTEELLATARVTSQQQAAVEAALGDVQGFFTPVPIPSAQPISIGSDGGVSSLVQLAAVRLVLPRTLLEAPPAIGPRPGV